VNQSGRTVALLDSKLISAAQDISALASLGLPKRGAADARVRRRVGILNEELATDCASPTSVAGRLHPMRALVGRRAPAGPPIVAVNGNVGETGCPTPRGGHRSYGYPAMVSLFQRVR